MQIVIALILLLLSFFCSVLLCGNLFAFFSLLFDLGQKNLLHYGGIVVSTFACLLNYYCFVSLLLFFLSAIA